MAGRKIIHVDMDAFYASVEQRDNPVLRGRPLVVGGDPNGRGVVAAASYEARAYGIHSAMPARTALQRCPDAVFLRPRFDVYRRVSRVIHSIFREYTDLVEAVALDEAYLDVTNNKKNYMHASRIAAEIRERIYQFTGLTASAGVAENKLLAKIASGYRKPDGLTIVSPGRVESFLKEISLSDIPGIGSVTEKRLQLLGINTAEDLRRCSKEYLLSEFGRNGAWFYDAVRGLDERAVSGERLRKSLGVERTYAENVSEEVHFERKLKRLSEVLYQRIQAKQFCARTLVLKVKFHTFERISRQTSALGALHSPEAIFNRSWPLLEQAVPAGSRVRLLGLSVKDLSLESQGIQTAQMELFPSAG